MRALFIGDVVGGPGRRAMAALMPELRREHLPELVIVNAENSAGGIGVTESSAAELFEAGADVLTSGNHVYRHRDAYAFIEREQRLIRPANYPDSNPGRGETIVDAAGMRVGVLNLSGALYMRAARSPFEEADRALERLDGRADAVIVDMHAELTSEKVAMGWHLDGRVAAVLGTHTHVPSADARVLPGGSAYITDVGMTGSRAGVIGVRREQSLEGFITQMPQRLEPADEDLWLMGALVEVGDDGRARSIEQLLVPAP